MPLRPTTQVNEDSSTKLTFQIQDENKVAIAKVNITSVNMTLKDKRTGVIINGRNNLDVLADVDSAGNFSKWLLPADNVLVSKSKRVAEETHIALFTIVATSGLETVTLNEEIWIEVLNLRSK